MICLQPLCVLNILNFLNKFRPLYNSDLYNARPLLHIKQVVSNHFKVHGANIKRLVKFSYFVEFDIK